MYLFIFFRSERQSGVIDFPVSFRVFIRRRRSINYRIIKIYSTFFYSSRNTGLSRSEYSADTIADKISYTAEYISYSHSSKS